MNGHGMSPSNGELYAMQSEKKLLQRLERLEKHVLQLTTLLGNLSAVVDRLTNK